jgi:hypothetical protein
MNLNPLLLLKLEWQKFGPNTTFQVVCVLYGVFFTLATLLIFLIGDKIEFSSNGQTVRPVADLLSFPRSWELVAYIGSWVNVILAGFLGVFMMTLELGNRTLRQNIISGMTRTDVFVAKISALLGIAALGTACYLVLGAVAGVLSSETLEMGVALPSLDLVARYFLQCFGYALLGTLLGLFIRQTALATLAYIAYVLFIELIVRWLLYVTVLKEKIVFFLPDSVLETLVSFPVPEMAQQMAGKQEFVDGLSPAETWIAAVGYLVLFAGVLWQRLQKADY